ncbi:MAG TPA: phytoene/squalene synthase family protein [Pseudolabrys sp.]|nr:phytoene/squalene synthase family protein [Pseudolabrys sp.]
MTASMQANFEHCAALVREADADRYLATLFAPAERRGALYALYAFNVEIGRVRELAREPIPGEIRLQWWREALEGKREGEARAHPVAAALRDTIERYALAVEPLVALVDAHEFDIYDRPMASLTDLDIYAERTDGAACALAADILGERLPAASGVIRHAGIAQTVAGILGELGRDASRRQLFLPLDVLTRHGVDPESIFAGETTDGLRAALAEMRLYARRQLAAARASVSVVRDEIMPALLPLAVVPPMLARMERPDYEPFRFVPAPRWRRQWRLWRAARNPQRIFG